MNKKAIGQGLAFFPSMVLLTIILVTFTILIIFILGPTEQQDVITFKNTHTSVDSQNLRAILNTQFEEQSLAEQLSTTTEITKETIPKQTKDSINKILNNLFNTANSEKVSKGKTIPRELKVYSIKIFYQSQPSNYQEIYPATNPSKDGENQEVKETIILPNKKEPIIIQLISYENK